MAVQHGDAGGKRTAVPGGTMAMATDVSAISQGPATSSDATTTAGECQAEPPRQAALIRPGTMVVSWDLQRVGAVRSISYDTASGLPARLHVKAAWDASTVTIPVRCIERILGGEVYLNQTLEQISRA